MKQTVWIAAAGALLLVGCKSEVMDERHYSPADRNAGEIAPPPFAKTVPSAATPVQASAPKAKTMYAPMTGAVSTGGVDSIGAAAGKSGEYVVRKGDTLGKIAAMHRVSLSALMDANNLSAKDAKHLYVGKKLVIPAGGKTAAASKSAKTVKADGKASAVPGETPALDKDGFYVLKSGDTIDRIARRFGVKSADILKVNGMSDADARHLQIGTKLAIPGKSAAAPAAAVAVAAAGVEAAVETDVAPVATSSEAAPAVVADTTAEDEALAENSVMAEVEEDISLADFAAKNGTTVEELKKLNKFCTDPLRKGDPILVPIKK